MMVVGCIFVALVGRAAGGRKLQTFSFNGITNDVGGARLMGFSISSDPHLLIKSPLFKHALHTLGLMKTRREVCEAISNPR